MNELTDKDAARIIHALTLQFPKVAQRLGVSKCAGHILSHLKTNGNRSFLEIAGDLNIVELKLQRVIGSLERNKYIKLMSDSKYRICEVE